MSLGHAIQFRQAASSQAGHLRISQRAKVGSKGISAYVSLAIFLTTLQSIYLPGFGAIICFAGLALLMPLTIKNAPPLQSFLVIAPIFLSFSISWSMHYYDMDIKTIFGSAVSLLAIPIMIGIFRHRLVFLDRALKWVLIAHVFFFAVQAVYWVVTRQFIDYISFFGAFEEASWSSRKGISLGGVLIPRFTGFFNEPGTFSAAMVVLLAARYGVTRRIDATTIVAALCVIGSVSLGGIVLLAGLGSIVFVDKIRSVRRRPGLMMGIIAMALPAICAVGYFAWINWQKRQELFFDSGVYEVYLAQWALDPQRMSAFGVGDLAIPAGIGVSSIGFWLEILLFYGLCGLVAWAIVIGQAGRLAFFLLAAIMLTKLKITYPFVFICFGAIFASSRFKSVQSGVRRVIVSPIAGWRAPGGFSC
ncbi:hypothetical protein [Caulobacter sp. 17J65-9]|uniref:hypothetical protein n=1 Tax=Caulobacter sp. 17J65-9 TaxID=2709382 RepID=UPI0013CBCF4B|nr:hypothetical protein [Caulobacter sp. 17J65-9]NEX92351.1 hypothetical protein [Caulobacter sp. 17J65-9]